MKQLGAELRFQLQNLPAHRRLLDAVGHVPHRLADAAVAGDVVEKLEMMDVQHGGIGKQGIDRAGATVASAGDRPPKVPETSRQGKRFASRCATAYCVRSEGGENEGS